MKLILDKNFIQETKEFTKEQDKALKFKGLTLDGKNIELVDMENDKIAPIVRFLAEGKKKKIGWLLILLVGLLLFLFFGLMVLAFYPKETPPPVRQVIQPTQAVQPVAEIKKIETQKENERETAWSLELMNEVDMFKNMKDDAEIETLKLTYEIDRLKLELEEKTKDNQKMTSKIDSLEKDLKILNTRKKEGATDEFIYYLGELVYKKCDKDYNARKSCESLYFNFLEYAKNR